MSAPQNQPRPDIFSYHDYAVFLKDWLNHLNQEGLSLRTIAREAGIATGYLPMFCAGKRKLSSKALEKLTPQLKLRSSERKYLALLHTIAKSEESSDRLAALRRIQRFHSYRERHSREIEVYRYLTKWFYVAIREMCFLKDFRNDPEWIQSRLAYPLSLAEVQAGLEFLKRHQYVREEPNGKLSLTEKDLTCKEGVFKISLGEFHRQMLGLASASIERTARAERNIGGETVAIRQADFEKIRHILERALDEVEKLGTDAHSAECVYHVEVAAFPLTSSPKEKPHEPQT